MSVKQLQTRVVNKHDLEANWLKATNFVPLKGELIVYDIEVGVDDEGKTITLDAAYVVEEDGSKHLPDNRTTPYTYERFKIGDGKTLVSALPFSVSSEGDVRLAEDLYTYTAIGKITSASNKSPVKVASAGDTLKTVFTKVFGEAQDEEPTSITDNRGISYSYSAGPTLGNASSEVGTTINTNSIEVTVTASGSCTSTYGYYAAVDQATGKPSTIVYGSNKSLSYAVKEQTINNDKKYKLKLTLPSNYYGNDGETPTVSVNPTPVYVNGKDIYVNATSVTITVTNTITEQTASSQTIYGAMKASCEFDALKDGSAAVLGFLTFQKNSAKVTTDITNALATKSVINKASTALTVRAGSYYNYYLASTSSALSSDIENPVTTATQYTSTSGVSIKCDSPSHIWFLLPPNTSGAKKIQYEPFANTWVDAFGGASDTTNGPVDVALELDSKAVVTYKGYYTSAKAAAGSNSKYKIV